MSAASRKLASFIQSTLFFLLVNFYWLSKNPHWGSLPPSVSYFFPLIAILIFSTGFISGVNYLKFNKNTLVIALLLGSIPIYGNLAEHLFHARAAGDGTHFVDIFSMDDNFYGFKPFIFESIIFLIIAKGIGETISGRHFGFVVYLSWVFQSIWAVAQFLYFLQPSLLEFLPLKPFSPCSTSGDDCFAVTRGQGLLANPFYYSWFVLSSYLVVQILNPCKLNIIILLSSILSISRGFIAASLIFLFPLWRNYRSAVSFGIFLSTVLGVIFFDELRFILDLRLESDVSYESRTLTNLWALEQFIAGNVFGVGWSVNYYTDSTYTSILLRSGLPGLVSYISAWILFYRILYKITCDKLVLYFAGMFFLTSFLVSGVEAQPGILILYTLYWHQLKKLAKK
jgi:hypothetical protein